MTSDAGQLIFSFLILIYLFVWKLSSGENSGTFDEP